MTSNMTELKDHLGTATEQFENYLEPWQRGLLLLTLTTLLTITFYYLTKKEKPQPRELTDQERKKLEALAEERILKRAEFLRRLRE